MIRKATKEDSLNLAALSIQVWLHTYASDGIRREISSYVMSTYTEQYFNDLLQSRSHSLLVCIKNNHLIGYIAANLKSRWEERACGFEIETLYVHEYFQVQGVGRRLLLEMARLHGGTYWLSTWVHNEKAIKFYKHLGFVDVGRKYFEFEGESHENRVLAFQSG